MLGRSAVIFQRLETQRNALKHGLIRHEIVMGDDECIDVDTDHHGEMLAITEKANHTSVAFYEERGYDLAGDAKRVINRVTSETASSVSGQTRTVPNTREHQDALQKCSTAGQLFRITGGGDVLTRKNMILAHERKQMDRRAKQASKIKDENMKYKVIEEKAQLVYAKDYAGWLKPDFQTAIQYKQGPVLDEGTVIKTTQNLPKLIEIYEEKFKGKYRDKSKPFEWTAKEEAELHDLIHGNIPNYKETMI